MLFAIDGSKALRKGIRVVFGEHAVVQRCQVASDVPRRNLMRATGKYARRFVDRAPLDTALLGLAEALQYPVHPAR